jgi:predicted DNA-binding transcriptional regulator AlpA
MRTYTVQADQNKIMRAIRRKELRKIVPLADSTIFEMERRGEFPKRFALGPRCVVWDLNEVQVAREASHSPNGSAESAQAASGKKKVKLVSARAPPRNRREFQI